MSMRMDPGDLGVHSWRMSKIWNMDHPSQADFLNESGHIWAGKPMYGPIMDQIREVISLGPQSKKREHQIKQKQLFLDLALIMKSFKKGGDQKPWTELILKMNGPRPINPIFKNFLTINEPVDVRNEEGWKTWYPPSETVNEDQADDVQKLDLPHNHFKPIRKIVNQGDDNGVDYGNDSDSTETEPDVKPPPPPRKPSVSKEPKVEASEVSSEYSYSYQEIFQDARPQSKSMAKKETSASASSAVQLVENPWTLAVVEQDWKNSGQTPIILDLRKLCI